MKKNIIFLITFILLYSFIIPHSSFSRGGKRRNAAAGMAAYKKTSVTTLEGTIISVNTVFNRFQKEYGLHLTIETSSGNYIVHVCPKWYADQQNLNFEEGESLTVTGATFIRKSKKNIYAATIVRSSSQVLKLRNVDTGKGLWSGRYKKERMKKRRLKRKWK
ncbi:MAG: hypothetical protein GY754_47230 [bacterium]|nr:hypothetical protein [bacterium]